jgi:hypothetical protein
MNSMRKTEYRKRVPAQIAIGGALLVLLGTSPRVLAASAWQGQQTPGDVENFLEQGQKTQAQRDAEQAQRDREQQARDREQQKKDAEQQRLDHMQELYDDGRGYLDEENYGDALKKFTELAELKGPQTDAALYWKAYAENKQGKRDAALSTIAELKKSYPQSRWKKDAEALEIEVRQGTGRPVSPEATSDADLKALALQGIMNSDSQRGIALIEQKLNSSASPKEKAKYLFVLAQNGSPQAQDALARIARGQSNPDLQRKAVEYLGMYGGKRSGATLVEIYTSSNDPAVKRAVIRAYLMSGDREHLLALAKGEKNEDLRREAIRTLGLTGGQAELQQLYQSEASVEAKKAVLQALFLSGDSQKLAQVAQNEQNPELRRTAVRNLGLMGAKAPELQAIYAKETDRSVKEAVIEAYFLGGNATALVAVARSEKDPELKKKAVEKLSLMGSKEGNDYLMEILQK